MDRPSKQPYSEILESIFAASTLEDAIFWREIMLGRLAEAMDAASQTRFTADEVQLHLEALHQIKLALENLRFCLLNNERTTWEPSAREWHNTAVWMRRRS